MSGKAKVIVIAVLASIVISGAWFMVLWKPQGATLEKAREEKAAAEQRADQLQARLNHLKDLEANAAVLERDRALLAAAIPDKDQLDQFITDMNAQAGKSGVSFVSIAPQDPGAAGAAPVVGAAAAATPIALQIQVTGDYFAILRFLEQVRDAARLVTVENFALSKGGEGGQMSASITGRMFLNQLGNQPVPGSAPAPASTAS